MRNQPHRRDQSAVGVVTKEAVESGQRATKRVQNVVWVIKETRADRRASLPGGLFMRSHATTRGQVAIAPPHWRNKRGC